MFGVYFKCNGCGEEERKRKKFKEKGDWRVKKEKKQKRLLPADRGNTTGNRQNTYSMYV